MRTRRTVLMDHTTQKKPRKTVCGNYGCQCSRIMANLEGCQTPYFFITGFDKRRGPKLPDQFVQKHSDEVEENVILDTATAAGQNLAVQFVAVEDEETGEVSIRIGKGWESFVLANELQPEDLLFFTLQCQARFIVMMIRGHSRREKTRATVQSESQKGNGKRKHCDMLDDLQEGPAAKKHKGPDPSNLVELSSDDDPSDDHDSTEHVTLISSDDPFESYMSLYSSDSAESTESDDCSNFEDESEFREFR